MYYLQRKEPGASRWVDHAGPFAHKWQAEQSLPWGATRDMPTTHEGTRYRVKRRRG